MLTLLSLFLVICKSVDKKNSPIWILEFSLVSLPNYVLANKLGLKMWIKQQFFISIYPTGKHFFFWLYHDFVYRNYTDCQAFTEYSDVITPHLLFNKILQPHNPCTIRQLLYELFIFFTYHILRSFDMSVLFATSYLAIIVLLVYNWAMSFIQLVIR